MSHPSLIDLFTRTLDPEPFRLLARKTLWSQRKGKIDPFEFITSLTFGQMSASRATLTSQAQSLSQPVSRQGIDQRFGPEAVDFFKASFAHIMAETLSGSPSHPQAESLRAHFKAVYLLDSTCYDCPETLQPIFPSCGGDGSAANAKVLLRYEVIAGCLEPLQVLEGKRSDQGLALATTQLLLEGQLQIQDKGFYDGKAWQAAFQAGAYLLMPLPHSLTLSKLIPESSDKEELDLAQALKHTSENRLEWSELWMGKEKRCTGPVRLVAFRLTPENASRKRQALRESMRTQGRTPSEKALQLAGWLLLITNAPPQKLPSSVISYLYRLRWQVELIFRQTKTVLRLDKTES